MAEIIDLTLSEDEIQPKRGKIQSPPVPNSSLYYVDVDVPPSPNLAPVPVQKREEGKLLLPAHVSVLGSVPVEIIAPSSEDQDYVEYLDYDGSDEYGITRYFQVEPDKSKASTIVVCKRCGAKGDHKSSACPVIICLTCGARNEHSTNSCPISKVCFSCGMKGHLNASCPNRGKLANAHEDCDRCGSTVHSTNECPTHWRIYTYVSDADRARTIEARQAKKQFSLGQGGEGYIAQDSWCYNCGDSGHWGDDCDTMSHVYDIPDGYSAFGDNNLSTGPFAEIQLGKTDRAPREWEVNSLEWNDWGGRVPTNVGKQGKKKEMARMRAHQTELDNGDEDDRFTFLAKPMRDNEKKINTGNGKKAPSQPKKMRFEINVKGAAAKLEAESGSRTSFGRMNTDSSPLKRKEGDLLGRMSDNKKPRYRKDGGGRYDRDRSRDGDRHGEDKDRGREYSRREERGPRYRGGYSNSYHR